MTDNQTTCVLIYDANCHFCRSQMERIRRRDRDHVFDFVSNAEPRLLEQFPLLRGSDVTSGLRLITPDGRIHAGADAVYEVGRRLPGWRRWAWIYRVPGVRVISERLYMWIARHRYQLAGPCDKGECDRAPGNGPMQEDGSA